MDLMTLVAKLTLDSSEYEDGLKDADNKASKLGKLTKVAKGVGVAAAAITTATAAAGGAFIKGAGNVAEFGDAIDKESQKLGISAEAYQEWDAILQHTGGSINNLKPAMKTLSKEIVNNSDAFQQLGISQEELLKMDKEDVLKTVVSRLQEMPEGVERTRLATQLLGRSSIELGALLNTSAEDTEKMRQKVHELGGVMSDEAVKASARYQDSLQDMQTAMSGVKRNIMSSFLPSLADAMDGIAALFSGDDEKGLGKIKDGVSGFIQQMTEAIPRFIEVGGTIVSALGQAIIENLPTLLEAGVQAIAQIAQGLAEAAPDLIPAIVDAVLLMVETLLDNIDLLIDAALQLGIGIAMGLIEATPKIVEKIPDIIVAIVSALIKAVPKIASAGVTLLGALVKNLPKIISTIVSAVPKIIAKLNRKFLDGIPTMVKAGVNLIKGLGKGIVNGASAVVQNAIAAAKRVLTGIKNALGIHSPSKITEGFGEMLDKGLAIGIEKHAHLAEQAMQGVSDALVEPLDAQVGIDETEFDVFDVPSGTTAMSAQPEPKEITVILQLDKTQLAKTVFKLNNEETQRIGVKLSGAY